MAHSVPVSHPQGTGRCAPAAALWRGLPGRAGSSATAPERFCAETEFLSTLGSSVRVSCRCREGDPREVMVTRGQRQGHPCADTGQLPLALQPLVSQQTSIRFYQDTGRAPCTPDQRLCPLSADTSQLPPSEKLRRVQ